MKEIILRNFSIFDLGMKMDEILGNTTPPKDPDDLLKNRFGETYTYTTLVAEYNAVKSESSSHDVFVKAFKLDYPSKKNKIYCIRLTENILIYVISNLEWQHALYHLPWDYPNLIVPFGTPGVCTVSEIASDFLNLSYLSVYFKYVLHQSLKKLYNTPKSIAKNTYALSDSLGVSFDWHIEFHPLEKGMFKNNADPIYIADTWYYTDEEILHDLAHLPALDFSERYHAISP